MYGVLKAQVFFLLQVKYMGVIQTLWFHTVKRRRANAAVVKSYIDLFHQRIPELLETVINLTDDEVWRFVTLSDCLFLHGLLFTCSLFTFSHLFVYMLVLCFVHVMLFACCVWSCLLLACLC